LVHHLRWRERALDPATTIDLFLPQVLHGNTAGRHVVHFGGWTFTDSAYCQARKRLPLAVYDWLVERTASAMRSASEGARRLGHRIRVVDGSSFSMPDEPELQRHFGQRKGCGFPVAKWLALFDALRCRPPCWLHQRRFGVPGTTTDAQSFRLNSR